MINSCIVTSVGVGYEYLIKYTLNDIPPFVKKIFIINDTGKKIVEEINDKRIVYLINKDPIGLSKSLEKWSKEYLKYDLIFRIDIGDKSTHLRFINQYNFMKNNPNHVLCGYETTLILPNQEKKKSFSSFKSKLIKFILFFKNCIVHGSICIRSDALLKSGGYKGHLKSCQDIDLYLRMMKVGKFAIIKGNDHSHKFIKDLSTTLNKRKLNFKTTSIIRFKAANKHLFASPLLLISGLYYYTRYLLEN